MFCVIYKFILKPNHETSFRQHWLTINQHLYQQGGSLGSRLHRSRGGDYIAYSQWTSRDQWQEQVAEWPDPELNQHQRAMRKCCVGIEILYDLDMTDDYLQSEGYSGPI